MNDSSERIVSAAQGGMRLRTPPADETQIKSLLEGASQAMLVVDERGLTLTANDRSEALLEPVHGNVVGRAVVDLFAPGDREMLEGAIASAFATQQGPADVVAALDHDGARIPIQLTFLPIRTRAGPRLAILFRDAVEPSTEQRARDRKLTDLGGLVSGVTHELRSPLTYLVNLVEADRLLIERLAGVLASSGREIEILREHNDSAREGLQRVTRILRELQPLSRNRPQVRAKLDLQALVEDAVRTFHGSKKGVAEVVLDLAPTRPVDVDLGEISRVVLNLLHNASDAMGGKGLIRVETRDGDKGPCIRVIDQGPGLAPEVEARLFEPFFTTKPDGTGIGLAISRTIVGAHGGTLLYSRVDGGACFTIALPPAEG